MGKLIISVFLNPKFNFFGKKLKNKAMIHYNQNGNYYVLLGIGYNLITFTLLDMIKQAKQIYNFDVLTVLN